MNFELFLNKENQQSYSLFKYLEVSRESLVGFSKIKADLDFSDFILKKTIKKLDKDIHAMKLDRSFQLIVYDAELMLTIDGKYSGKRLLSQYLRESLAVNMIAAIFKKEFESLTSFAEEHFVSYSVAYNTLKMLNSYGITYEIKIKRKDIFDNTHRTPSFLCSLFVLADLNYEQIYIDKIIGQAEEIVQALNKKYPLTFYEQKELFHYIAIRLQIGHLWIVVDNGRKFFPKEYLKKVQKLLPKEYVDIVYHVSSWLFIHNKFDDQFPYKKLGSDVMKLNQRFITKLEERCDDLPSNRMLKLSNALSRFHFNILYRSTNAFDPWVVDYAEFESLWPDFYTWVSTYVEDLIFKYPELRVFKEFLLFSYLMLLADNIEYPYCSSVTPVRIFIDFAQGDSYNRLIKDNLSSFVPVNIITVNSLEQAEIVLTNVNDLYKNIDLPVLVWSDGPQVVDWTILTEQLKMIQKNNQTRKKI